MRIIALADIHGYVSAIEPVAPELAAADVVLLAGDITNFGSRADAERVIQAISAWNPRILAVPGNCDPPDVAHYLSDKHMNLYIRRVYRGIAFVGAGGSLPCPGTTPYETNEEGFALALATAYPDVGMHRPSVLVTHQPPYSTRVDLANGEMHVGSTSIRDAIERHKPLICFTGHIHEAVGLDKIGDTIIVNPGPLRRGGFALAEIADGKVVECTIASAAT